MTKYGLDEVDDFEDMSGASLDYVPRSAIMPMRMVDHDFMI